MAIEKRVNPAGTTSWILNAPEKTHCDTCANPTDYRWKKRHPGADGPVIVCRKHNLVADDQLIPDIWERTDIALQ